MPTKVPPDSSPLAPTPATNPDGGRRRVSANELRWLAEEADGKRGEKDEAPYEIVWRKVGEQWRLGLEPKGTSKPEDVVAAVDVFTPFEGPGLRTPSKIQLIYGDSNTPHLLQRIRNGKVEVPDAIFLTQSAFGKFVIPYYSRFRSPNALVKMTRKYFQDPATVGVIHFRPSEDEAVRMDDEETPSTNFVPLQLKDGTLSPGESV